MAEIFGAAISAAGIAQVFASCVTCFDYIQIGRRFGKGFQTDLLTLKLLEVRLSRWGAAVKVFDQPPLAPLRQLGASHADVEIARGILQQILMVFEDSAQVSQKFRLNAKPGEDLGTFTAEDLNGTTELIYNTMHDLASRGRNCSNILNVGRWALYDKMSLSRLISEISRLIDNLEKVFPAPQLDVVLASYCSQDAEMIRSMVESRQSSEDILNLLGEISSGVDKALAGSLKASAEFRGVSIDQIDFADDAY